jgi:nicotinate phosphoribosyltransferase
MNDPIINSLLDLDLYKITQALHAHTYFPEAEVGYGFFNRSGVNLLDYIDPLELMDEIDHVRSLSLSPEEKQYVNSLSYFKGHEDFVDMLEHPNLPPVEMGISAFHGERLATISEEGSLYDLRLQNHGFWYPNILWETIIMSIVNELYFRKQGSQLANYNEGHRRISEKIEYFNKHPELKGRISEFGTRRRYSAFWQAVALERYLEETDGYIVGTSNVKLAMEYNIKPIGTMAHELLMFYDTYYANADSQERALQDWYNLFGYDLSIGLTDTFGSDFYFDHLMDGIANMFKGHRHDSGCPHKWSHKFVSSHLQRGIDPSNKVGIYSDGLIPEKMVEIVEPWQRKLNPNFGWGTNCTNDLGPRALSMVVKMTEVKINGIWMPTVKLSDNLNKEVGTEEAIEQRKERYGHNHSNRETCIY